VKEPSTCVIFLNFRAIITNGKYFFEIIEIAEKLLHS